MSDPTIRLAEGETDLNHARSLFRSYAAEFDHVISESLRHQGFEMELASLPGRYASPSGCLLLAMEVDHPAGCVALRDLGGGTCEMKRLYVAPPYRGSGLGRRLAAEILTHAERAGYLRMVLDTLPAMVEAIALYRSFGFVESGAYSEKSIEGTLFLQKRLGLWPKN